VRAIKDITSIYYCVISPFGVKYKPEVKLGLTNSFIGIYERRGEFGFVDVEIFLTI
jgi:hypothetical protein